MDVPDEATLDVDLLGDDGSEEDAEAPPSTDFYAGPGSTPTSCASSPRGEEPASPHGSLSQPPFFHHQPYTRPFFTSGRRGPGRPRKEGVKLAKEGKIVRRYRGGLAGSVRGAKRNRISREDSLDDAMEEGDDFTMPAPDDPPYMPEKWPGKVCALCNLSERSQLGQGEMRQYLCNIEGEGGSTPAAGGGTPTPTSAPATPLPPGLASPPPEIDPNQLALVPLSRRQKAFNKCKTPLYNMEHTDELSIIGHQEVIEIPAVVSSGAFYVHRCCLEFTPPFQDQVPQTSTLEEDREQLEDSRVRGIVIAALSRKCTFCQRHGASIPCKMSCSKYFHFPCVLASGGFLDFLTKSSFCKDHLYQVPLICNADIECRTCHTIGDIPNLMTCIGCGAHYHGTCVGLAQLPGVRAGWCCRVCRACQVCRNAPPPADPRAVACELCDKLYHAACLRPPINTVPKYGWKCKCCRVCSDCGARSPGAGPSSRWHAHYTVCDSCYQQRNKGSCCPLCRRAYRAAAYRAMIRCRECKRYVHGMCDPEADPQTYRARKEQNPGYSYTCPICKAQLQVTGSKTEPSFEDSDTMASTSQDSSFGDDNSQQEQDPLAIEPKQPDVGLGKGKPFSVSSKVAKKKISGYKLKGGYPHGKIGFKKRQRSALEFGRKRGSKPKMRGVFGVPGLGLQRPQAPDTKTADDDPGVENKLVLCSSKDKFVLTQDLCVMCGAIGTDAEGILIACAQCGQSYHPYCVNIKVSAVIVTLGWRCLDCTVCEGCGQRSDDARLILCDDCDTAWHTYCCSPALPAVPPGAWRCARCRQCRACGARSTPHWTANYTECGPCASLVMCCICSEPYSDGELIIQCFGCSRWLHAACDSIRTENDAQICCKAEYKCQHCRGRDVPAPHVARALAPAPAPRVPRPSLHSLGLAGEYYVDDVCLSQRGAHHMKQLEAEMGVTHTRRKRRFKHDADNTPGAAEQEPEDKPEQPEVKEEPGLSNIKEGVLWTVSTDGPPPEGFAVHTTETGVTVLRRKRQRNLNKLGIGGFVVRQRQTQALRAQQDEDKEMDMLGESPSNKRKPRRKPRSKLMEQFPPYMQEAFFGKELTDRMPTPVTPGNPSESPNTLRPPTPEGYRELRDFKLDFDNSDSDGEDIMAAVTVFNPALTIQLNQDEIDLLKTLKPKDDKDNLTNPDGTPKIKSENDDGNLKHTEDSTALKNAILGPQSGEQETPVSETANSTKTEPMSEAGSTCESTSLSSKDELSLLNVNLDAMVRDTLPDMDTNDVDEIFKGVFTDDSQESQESSVSYVNSMAGTPYSQQRQQLHSPMDTYPSPYHNEYPTSTQSALSPMLSENNSWGSQPPPASYNQRSADKMRADESLGSAATISAVLYANTNHPEWKTEFPNWVDRCKQILKKWRALPAEQKAPYLQRARDNRSAIRMKKAQQPGACQPSSAGGTGSEEPPAPPVTSPAAPAPPAAAVTSSPPVRAPNVTVTAGGLLEADAHIRVLTPSEIMRTLPRLPTEQERSCGQQRSAREAEQERQWKQLQQQRQQQTQQQQQIIHDQRIQAMQRIRAPDGSEITGPPTPMAAEAPRSVFPAQRFPLHYANTEDINRQLRDLLQRHPEKMWSQQAGEDGNIQGLNMDGQPFRQPLPVGMRPRMPLQPGQRPEHLIIQQRLMSSEGQIHQNIQNSAAQQQQQKMVQNSNMVQNMGPSAGNEPKQEQNQDHGTDEMDMGDMDKLEQDTGNIGEVGDILTGLGGEDDEELLESLTAEIGEQFNILEYADPELAALNDTEHILDGLDLADDDKPKRDEMDQKPETKPDLDHLNKSGLDKVEIKTEMEIKSENTQEIKPSPQMQLFAEGVQRIVSQQGHQLMQQQAMASRQVQFNQAGQQIITQQVVQRPQVHFTGQQLQHFAQQGGNAASIANAMAQVRAALANRGPLVRRLLPTQQGGAPGSPQPGLAPGATARAPPPPPYPGTLRPPQPPPPPYPQTCVEAAAWPEWLHRRPLLLQEQPLLLEELLEQEKREQEREGGEWGAGGALPAPAAAAGGVPLYARAPPPAPPPPPDPPQCDADHRARLLYEAWLKQYNAFAADQLRYYEAEVQKLRKIRKSLNSKQRQLRKAGNELLPNDAAELQRVSTEQQALQKHLEAARKQARQHTMLIQEYESKHRPPNPQVAQQTVIAQQQLGSGQTVYTTGGGGGGLQAAGGLRAGMALGLGGGGARVGLVAGLGGGARLLPGGRTLVIEQAGARAAAPQFARAQPPRPAMSPQSPIHHLPSPQHQPAMSPIHQHSPMHHQHSPMHQPMQSPLQSPLHVQQTSMHVQQSPMTSQQSPMHVQQSPMSQQQQSPMHVQQSPMSQQQSPMHVQQSVMTSQQSPMHVQQSVMTSQQSPMHVQQSPMSQQQSPMHVQQQSPMHVQQSPMSQQQSPMHVQQSPMSQQQSPMHIQQSPMSQQQSPMQSMSPQHFLQQLQAQRTSPQLPQPSRSPQIYQQTQIQSPVSSHSPQLQNSDYSTGRFSRPAPGCSPLPTRFARPPHHQQGMRVPFGGRQQTSPLGSPQPLPSPGNPASELARQQMLQRQQYSPMGGAPSSPSLSRSPHVARTPTPSASPAASPAPHQDHGGGGHHGHHMAPVPLPPPGYRYYKPGLFGGAPVWPNKDDNRRQPHINKVSILKRKTPPRPRFGGKTAAPGTSDDRSDDTDSGEKKYVLYSTDMEYTQEDVANLTYDKDDDDDDIEEFVEHLDDDDIVVVEPGAISPQERIATEEDFEELIDSGKPEDEVEEETQVQEKTAMRTETTTKTVAVISLATKQSSSNVQQYKLMNTSQCGSVSRIPLLSATVLSPHANTKILNDVSQATVASVSIANQTISVPVLKSLSQVSMSGHTGGKTQIKKMPLNLTNQPLNITMSAPPLSKPISSVISVISSNVTKGSSLNPVITLATSNTSAGTSRVPVSILTQHQVKHKIVKTIEKPMGLSSLSNSKLSSLSVSHDATLPAKIFQDDAASPDSTVTAEGHYEKEHLATTSNQHILSLTSQSGPLDQHPPPIIKDSKDIDIETEISQQTELPHSLCITDRTPLLLGKADIKSPDPIPEKIPDNIMEGDDDDKPEDNLQSNLLLSYNKPLVDPRPPNPPPPEKSEENVMKTLKAIANQTKEMVIDSNMQITSDVTQESVQISIPSPTPSQERYLNDITMQEHVEPPEGNPKHVESFEDMLCMLENISDDAKAFNLKQAQNNVNQSQRSNAGTPTKPENKEVQEQQQQFVKKEPERSQLQSATVPQLSPLSQPAELTSNMANVSQQLRTIMSSLNTSKVESQTVSSVMKRNSDATTPTQVNFENLLPSSKVEVPAPRPPPVQRMDISSLPGPENIPMNASQMIGSRVNSLSGMGQMRKSPGVSPINSPVSMQNQLMKSPAQSPLLTSQSQFSQPEDIITASAPQQQIIQMPGLTKIFTSSTPTSLMHSNAITTSVSSFQKGQVLPTSILGHTLLQPTRQISTGNLQYNPQCISSSQPPALVMTSRPIIGNKDAPPNVTVRTHSLVSPGLTQMQGKPQTGSINFITSSKLLHTQLTSPLKRSKSTDEPKSDIIVGHIQPAKRHSVESVIVKSEPMETDDPNATSASDISNKNLQQAAAANQRNDESQNVLLKQLLQTSTTAATAVPQRAMTIQRTAPALGTIPSLEAQLARPSIPPASTLAALSQEVEIPKSSPRHISSVGSPFGARPIQTCVATSSMSPLMQTSTTQSLMDVRKPQPKVVKEETTPMPESSPTPKPMMQQTYPMTIDNQQLQQPIKKEIAPPQQSPIHRPFTPMDVKKELLDESSQQSATSGVSTASDQGNTNMPMKEEYPEGVNLDLNSENNTPETPSEAKKRKRREYQQKKRKQMQMSIKAAAENSMTAANAKKRPRKGSRYEEDYDTFIDNLMTQLRLLPPMQIQEPSLTTNFSVCPLFGSGDLTKLKNKDNDIFKGDLLGEFGNARIPNVADYYNTKPFGDEEPLPEKPPASTQRGFYDQEFQPIQFDDDPEDKKLDFICKERDTDTPDTIVSCSSPECLEIDPPNRFPGLKLTDDEDEDQDSDSAVSGRASPIIPIIAPVPIRIKPLTLYHIKDEDDGCKSLRSYDRDSPTKSKMLDSPSSTESNENVTVTLTLTSGAAEDILGVLKELAGILHIPPPTSYQIVERTATPPSHKLGLYRSKGKDGKEGTPIDIQSILNGAAKFCRHCDVVILDSVVRAKASEFPLLSANKGKAGEILCDSDSDLYFCSTQCYERFAWRPTNIILDGKSSIKEDSKSDVETNLSKDRDDFDTASTESMETDDLDIKPDIKDEKMDLSFIDSLDNDELMKEVGDDVSALDEELKSETSEERGANEFRGVRYKAWAPGCIVPAGKFKRASDRELRELVFRVGVSIRPVGGEDARRCELCGLQGDGPADGVARLLNCDVDRWVHLNCALWSDSVYETVSGALMNLEAALAAGCGAACQVCRRLGATVRCFKVRCGSVYHLGCAVKDNCVFYKNKSAFCASHAPKNEKDNELTTLSVQRRVYVSRDEQRQVASVMLHSDTNHLIRVGGLIFLSPGHLLPHQLPAFHTPNYIYPVGYKIVRFYWSMRSAMQRARYVCWVSEVDGRPRFHVRAQADAQEWAAPTPRAAWAPVLDAVAALREERNEEGVLKLWSNFITGEDLFGFTEPAIVRVLESLPGIETLTDYRFKFGRSALLEGGLAVNPSGCARCEPRGRCWRRPARSLVPAGAALPAASAEPACPYSKQFVHTKSSQYKKMKLEWRNNVYLARSKIQGLGLYAARDLEKNTMVIEYIGEIIRSELSEIREKQYEAKNRGIYMFRLDERRVVDATLCGGLARYINHSCQPNCVAELVEVDRHLRIIIMSKRRIARGEELAYDYKFDIEDDAHKIMCMCGAPNCKKWMN